MGSLEFSALLFLLVVGFSYPTQYDLPLVDWVSPLFSEQLKSFHLLLLPWGLFRSAPHGFLSWRSIGIYPRGSGLGLSLLYLIVDILTFSPKAPFSFEVLSCWLLFPLARNEILDSAFFLGTFFF